MLQASRSLCFTAAMLLLNLPLLAFLLLPASPLLELLTLAWLYVVNVPVYLLSAGQLVEFSQFGIATWSNLNIMLGELCWALLFYLICRHAPFTFRLRNNRQTN